MTVTAIAGPWLRLETAHRIVSNQRVLVIMKIENAVAKPGQNGFETQVIEDTGEIKNIEQKGDNFIVSIELTGLSDSDIDHLVSVAKRVAVKSASQAAGKEGAGEAAEETKENYKAAGAGARQ
jgi:ribosomal protein L12E/L44/L45/RPP1/RPP2